YTTLFRSRSADARAARPRSGYCRRSAGGTRRDPIHGPGAHALAGAAQFYDVSPELVWRAGAVFGWCWNLWRHCLCRLTTNARDWCEDGDGRATWASANPGTGGRAETRAHGR